MRITLVGRIDTVMEYDEDTCQARFLMEYENHIYECFGYAPGLTEGLEARMALKQTEVPENGKQEKKRKGKETESTPLPPDGTTFDIIWFSPYSSSTKNGVRILLQSKQFLSIGKDLAERIVDQFGDDTAGILECDAEQIAKVKGIGKKRMAAVRATWKECDAIKDILLFTDGAFSLREADRIKKYYGDQASEILRNDIFQLCRDLDFSFRRIDVISEQIGMQRHDIRRMRQAVAYILEEASRQNGHCYLRPYMAKRKFQEALLTFPETLKSYGASLMYQAKRDADRWDIRRQNIIEAYKLTKEDSDLLDEWQKEWDRYGRQYADTVNAAESVDLVVSESNLVALKSLYDVEQSVADMVMDMSESPCICEPTGIDDFLKQYEETHFVTDRDGNREHVKLAAGQKEAINRSLHTRISIITGGPGYGKTTVIQEIALWWKQNVSSSIIMVAPTGRAAKRMAETTKEVGCPCATIHRMIGICSDSPMVEPTNQTLILCDEASMVDIFLAKELMQYSQSSTLILIGDADQLPPVGPGNFFRDLIASGRVPVSTLTECFRNAGRIVENAIKINTGNPGLSCGDDFFVCVMDKKRMVKAITDTYLNSLSQGMSPSDICVLSPCRKYGTTGANMLNRALQDACNPQRPGLAEWNGFRVGDRVMQMKNNYQMTWVWEPEEGNSMHAYRGCGIFNGDTGTILEIKDNTMVIRMDDGIKCRYGSEDIEQLSLAYASTVHKAQGSEYKRVLMVLAEEHGNLLNRSIFYTAETRTKKDFALFCELPALKKAVETIGSSQRFTRLQECLMEKVQPLWEI